MKFIAIILARYASTRFPGKPLAVLGGHTVIDRVYHQVVKVLPEAYVATDDERIFNAVESFGGKAVMTRSTITAAPTALKKPLKRLAPTLTSLLTYRAMSPLFNPRKSKRYANNLAIPTHKLPPLVSLLPLWMPLRILTLQR